MEQVFFIFSIKLVLYPLFLWWSTCIYGLFYLLLKSGSIQNMSFNDYYYNNFVNYEF